MSDLLQKEKRKVFTFHLKQNIENGEWQKLIKVLPGAEDAGVENKLLLKSYLLLGDNFRKKEPHADAIIYYSKAVSLSDDESIYLKLVASIKSFYILFKTVFSKADLQSLQSFLRSVYTKTVANCPNSLALQSELKLILSEAKTLEETTAKELIESSATPWIDKVYNSFYRPKSPQEVFERFSEVINDSFQDFYDEESKKESENDKKKKKSKKKKKKKDE
ncbi:MAG: hypothetical protein KJO12_07915 [Ignavibacteria bacterium]|nr:hypothetical protein [Ignavibacteria bacterium]